ncbi:receptor-like protein kinase, partial [Genlisea aurea]
FFIDSSVAADSDADALLRFKASLENGDVLSDWNAAVSPCDGASSAWRGVLCDHEGRVWGLKMENMGLAGGLDLKPLSELSDLRTISFMHNGFEGSLPDLRAVPRLKSVYLSYNKFDGDMAPTSFDGMASLKKLYLGNNEFTGPIPAMLARLPNLREVSLENNGFEGELPSFDLQKLVVFNVSNNDFVGPVPRSLSHFAASSFQGNRDLCGFPLQSCPNRNHATKATIIVVGVLIAVALAALVLVAIILFCRKTPTGAPRDDAEQSPQAAEDELERAEQGRAIPTGPASSPDQGKHSVKLTFLRDDVERFDMPELLKASAEILGSGAVGSTYKASLGKGRVMVVKRFRHMNDVSREEFNEHMRRLGRLGHQNILPIVAFYYRREEKLLVADYMANESLAAQLHRSRSNSQTPSPLTWPTRLSIVKGVVKGLQYLYNELPSLTAPHGHLKSSNVLLDGSFRPLLADYALVPVVNQEHAQENMISYKSPEYKLTRRITKKTDIWSLGILILEMMTGRFPSSLLQQGEDDADLAGWAESALRDGAADLFDRDMNGASHSQGEMMKLLKIGLMCCEAEPERRPELRDVVASVEEIREKDEGGGDDEFYSVYTSEAD